jgi:(heptosyl)LPS beta-1,4-glucosyltransferase
MPSISALVFCKNSQRTIQTALQSVRFCDEVILIDMGGRDDTVGLSHTLADKVHSFPADYVEEIREEAAQTARGDWLLVLDADEEVPDSLARHITSHLSDWTMAVGIPRKNMMFGRFIAHTGWWPDYQIRLYPKGSVVWSKKIHEPPIVTGEVHRLPAKEDLALIHHHIHTVDEYLERIRLFTAVEGKTITTTTPTLAAREFFSEFNRRYYFHEGYKDGDVGVYLTFLQSFSQFLMHLKSWEYQGYPKKKADIDLELNRFVDDLAYWRATKKMSEAASPIGRLWWRIRRKARQ